MANPAPLTYTSPVPRVGGGREVFPNRILNLLAGIADGQWVKANTNTFESVFPSDKTPNYGPSLGKEWMVINAWSSMGWDSRRHRICLFGGGHANTNDSALYVWDGESGQWMVGYYSPEVLGGDEFSTDHRTKDGHLIHPISSHTYSGNNYLAVLDRFYTQGGAAQNWGGGFRVYDPAAGAYRSLAGYLCQLELAGQGFVGGGTGNNWIRPGGKPLPGARAWEVLDYLGKGMNVTFTGVVSGGSVARVEDGVDVVYRIGGVDGIKSLRKMVMPSLDITTHTITRIGRYWGEDVANDVSGAIDEAADVLAIFGKQSEGFWDLKTQSETNNLKSITSFVEADVYAQFLADKTADLPASNYIAPGAASDPRRKSIFVWVNGRNVYKIDAPIGNPTPKDGWHIALASSEFGPRPMTGVEIAALSRKAAVWGKWRYAPDLDCYVGLQHPNNGDVWLWRPPAWKDPREA